MSLSTINRQTRCSRATSIVGCSPQIRSLWKCVFVRRHSLSRDNNSPFCHLKRKESPLSLPRAIQMFTSVQTASWSTWTTTSSNTTPTKTPSRSPWRSRGACSNSPSPKSDWTEGWKTNEVEEWWFTRTAAVASDYGLLICNVKNNVVSFFVWYWCLRKSHVRYWKSQCSYLTIMWISHCDYYYYSLRKSQQVGSFVQRKVHLKCAFVHCCVWCLWRSYTSCFAGGHVSPTLWFLVVRRNCSVPGGEKNAIALMMSISRVWRWAHVTKMTNSLWSPGASLY